MYFSATILILSFFFVFYAYLGYPFVLYIFSLRTGLKYPSNDPTRINHPHVSIVISAFNEEGVIAAKIKNSLNLEYPAALKEIIVISDGSTDATDQIVSSFADQGVRLIRQEDRCGKTSALNAAMPHVRGDIVVFSDANAMYGRSALKRLTAHFIHPRIGFVSGRTIYIQKESGELHFLTNSYTEMEIFIKTRESRLGCCIGADGAIFAIRKYLYQPLNTSDINDFVIPLQILSQGYKGIIDEKAFCLEEAVNDSATEFRRQIRIAARTIRALFNYRYLINPLRFPSISFCLISHKIMKYLVPYFLIILFTINLMLISMHAFWFTTFFCQILFYFIAAIGALKPIARKHSRILSLSYSFCLVNISFLIGWYKFIVGEAFTTWAPARNRQ